jgi:hypothetical protein
MTWTRWSMVAYSVAMAGFGAYGTMMHPNEKISLIAGVTVAAIILVLMFWSRTNPRVAYGLSLLVSILVMAYAGRSVVAKGFYPQGVVFLMTLALALALVGGHLMAMAAKKREA